MKEVGRPSGGSEAAGPVTNTWGRTGAEVTLYV
jgi:hypothetical protein